VVRVHGSECPHRTGGAVRRLIATGVGDSFATRPGLYDVVRASQIDPIDLLRTLTPRDEIVLLGAWHTDPESCALVAVGLWVGLAFLRVEGGQLVSCTPRSPAREFTEQFEGAFVG
jgi:hypothetical protein